jgi:signal transduction histidine kinase
VVLGETDDLARTPEGKSLDEVFRAVQRRNQERSLDQARAWTAVSIGALAVVCGLGGWLIAGRVLRSVRLVTVRARAAASGDLRSRVALGGPDDELKELATTFDGMLDRLERAFAAQTRFAGQVSHELRTPLSVIRGEVDLLLAERDVDERVRGPLVVIEESVRRAERLIAAMLVLTRIDSGDVRTEVVALDDLVGDAVARAVEEPAWRGLDVRLELRAARTRGDRDLLESLTGNLLENAARHNRREGWIGVDVHPQGADVVLEVANSVGDRAPQGHRVGLSVVQSIVDACGGVLDLAQDDGAFVARVRLASAEVPVGVVGAG